MECTFPRVCLLAGRACLRLSIVHLCLGLQLKHLNTGMPQGDLLLSSLIISSSAFQGGNRNSLVMTLDHIYFYLPWPSPLIICCIHTWLRESKRFSDLVRCPCSNWTSQSLVWLCPALLNSEEFPCLGVPTLFPLSSQPGTLFCPVCSAQYLVCDKPRHPPTLLRGTSPTMVLLQSLGKKWH